MISLSIQILLGDAKPGAYSPSGDTKWMGILDLDARKGYVSVSLLKELHRGTREIALRQEESRRNWRGGPAEKRAPEGKEAERKLTNERRRVEHSQGQGERSQEREAGIECFHVRASGTEVAGTSAGPVLSRDQALKSGEAWCVLRRCEGRGLHY